MSDEKGNTIGAAWNPRDQNSRAICSGTVTIKGWKQRFTLFRNYDKKGDRHPDYSLVSWDEPEEDTFTPKRHQEAETEPDNWG